MPDVRSNTANAFETTLTGPVSGTDLTFNVTSTSGAPGSPCYLCIDPDDPAKREYVWFDGSFTGTSFVTTDLNNRHLDGSAASSGITHESGAVVRAITAAQLFIDLHDRVENRLLTANHNKALHDSLGIDHGSLSGMSDDDHPQYALADGTRDGVPSGIIAQWFGTAGNVPNGWAICDGTNGTPDLRDKFIVGAGGLYSPDDTGGSADAIVVAHSHGNGTYSAAAHGHGSGTLIAASHTHGSGSYAAASHAHTINRRDAPTDSIPHGHPGASNRVSGASGTSGSNTTQNTGNSGSLNVSGSSGSSGSLNVSGSTSNSGSLNVSGTSSSQGSSGTNANLPPYHALYLIMKL